MFLIRKKFKNFNLDLIIVLTKKFSVSDIDPINVLKLKNMYTVGI